MTSDMTASAVAGDPLAALLDWCRERRSGGAVRVDEKNVWHVFSHAEVSRVLSDHATFSSDSSEFTPAQADFDLFAKGNIVDLDPPRHTKLRKIVNQALTARVIDELTPRIEAIAVRMLDAVAGRRDFDFVDVLAAPLPITVIAELLGVPASDHPIFRAWTDDLFSRAGDDGTPTLTEETLEAAAPTMRTMIDYLHAHVRARRTAPSDDLIGKLVAAEVDGERLDDDELVGFAGLLLIAGQITTMSLLGNAVIAFDAHPAALAQVRADRALVPRAVEEVLRYRSPFPRLDRVTRADVDLAGQHVPAGSLVMPWIIAANRDPDRFDRPDEFDIHRDAGGHLAFGRGIHFCLGAPLARLEARIVVDLLLDRYSSIAVSHGSPASFHNPHVLNGAKRLPVTVGA